MINRQSHPADTARLERERLCLAAQSTRDFAILTIGLDGRITSWNAGAEHLFGYEHDEAIGERADRIFTPEDRERGIPEHEMNTAREQGRAEDERWHLRKDGSRFYCSGIMTALFDDGGALCGYAKIARDLTGRKRAEHRRNAQLQHESAERASAEAANHLKDEFLAVMSHELKNPLNLINLNAEVLSLTPEVRLIPAAARAAEIIRRAVLSQAQIIDDLLDLSRVNTGKMALHPEPVDWAAVIEAIVRALGGQARDRDLELTVELPEARPVVDADPVRVEQIVWNLLSNALKFTPPGGRIEVRLDLDGDCARLDVSDSGRGLDAADLPVVFDMFRQVRADSPRQRGLGIGLALVRQLAELHGGRVEAASPGLGAGATFSVWLPLQMRRQEQAESERAARSVLAGLEVLIVDDSQENTEGLQRLLVLAGCSVTAANSGAAALELAGRRGFDLILSDLAMPDVDGFELVEALRRNPATRAVPAIALSGFGRGIDTQRALAAGFDAHLRKPFALDQLVRALEPLQADRSR